MKNKSIRSRKIFLVMYILTATVSLCGLVSALHQSINSLQSIVHSPQKIVNGVIASPDLFVKQSGRGEAIFREKIASSPPGKIGLLAMTHDDVMTKERSGGQSG